LTGPLYNVMINRTCHLLSVKTTSVLQLSSVNITNSAVQLYHNPRLS